MFLFHASVTLSSIFACTVLVDVHCDLNITVRNKIKLDICFCYYISHNIANVIILLHYICCSSTLRMQCSANTLRNTVAVTLVCRQTLGCVSGMHAYIYIYIFIQDMVVVSCGYVAYAVIAIVSYTTCSHPLLQNYVTCNKMLHALNLMD